MKKLIQFYADETGSESIEKITIIGGAVALAVGAVIFFTYQFNKGASTGATKASEAGTLPPNIKVDGGDGVLN